MAYDRLKIDDDDDDDNIIINKNCGAVNAENSSQGLRLQLLKGREIISEQPIR